MASSIQCPSCRVRIAVRPGLTACPGCGARLKKKARPADDADDGSTDKPRKKKRKKKAGPNYAMLAAAGGGFVILAAIAVMVAMVLDRPKRKDDPAGPPVAGVGSGQPGGGEAGPTWLAKADPPRAAVRPKDDLAIPIAGQPVFASGQAPFVADMVTAAAGPDAPQMAVYDLRTGERALAARAINWSQVSHGSGPALEPMAALGPDGKTVAIRTVRDEGKGRQRTTITEAVVYRLGQEGAPVKITVSNWVPWMAFGRDEDQLIVVNAPPAPLGGLAAMAYDLKRPDQPPLSLEVQRTPIRARNGFKTPESIAVSPGRNYLAVGEGRFVDVLQLADGKLAGRCELPGDCVSVAFSADGAELIAHSHIPPPRGARGMPTQYQWSTFALADGKAKSVHQVGGGSPPGPVLAAGPKPGLAIHGTRDRVVVMDTRYGAPVYTAPFPAVRAFDPDQLLVFDADAKQIVVRRIDTDQMAAGEAEVARLFGPRPTVVAADRTALAAPTAPAGWAVPVDGGPAENPALVDRYKIDNGADFVMPWVGRSALSALTIHRVETPRERYALKWRPVDLTSGNAEADVELWPSALPPGQVPTGAGFGAYLADHAADGSRIAVRDPATPGRVDVWDRAGKRLLGFHPYGPETPVDALVWVGENRFITRGGGQTTGWDIAGAAPKAVFELGGYVGTHVLPPGRKWIGMQSDRHIDVFETATGRPLGRLEHSNPSKKPWPGFAVSRDGRLLAAVELERPGSTVWSVATWDLSTGQRKDLRRMFGGSGPIPGALPVWVGARTLLVGGADVIDLEVQATIATLPAGNPVPSPDGRHWSARAETTGANNQPMPMEALYARSIEDVTRGVPQLVPADVVFRDGTTVEPLAETGDNGRDAVARSILAQKLTSEGYPTGGGGWKLKVSGQQTAGSGASLETPKGEKIRVPGINGKIELIDPAGAVVWTGGATGGWDMNRSKYKTGKEDLGPLGGSITHFNFGLKDPVTAMAEEAWDNFMENVRAGGGFPRVMARVDGKVVPLPVVVKP